MTAGQAAYLGYWLGARTADHWRSEPAHERARWETTAQSVERFWTFDDCGQGPDTTPSCPPTLRCPVAEVQYLHSEDVIEVLDDAPDMFV